MSNLPLTTPLMSQKHIGDHMCELSKKKINYYNIY